MPKFKVQFTSKDRFNGEEMYEANVKADSELPTDLAKAAAKSISTDDRPASWQGIKLVRAWRQ